MTYYEKKHNRMVELIQAYDASRDESIYQQMVELSDVLWAVQELNDSHVQGCLRNKSMNIHKRADALLERAELTDEELYEGV